MWLEYLTVHPDGYRYPVQRYRAWRGRIDVVMRQVYRAGEKAFVDYAGPKFEVVEEDRRGEGAMVFGCARRLEPHLRGRDPEPVAPDWTMSHVRMFEFWGGVPELVIASRYEPDLNPTYQELATHYGTTVLPARPRAPRDKAKVEAAVQHAERWIMAPLRNQTFFSLGELREAIAPLLAALNERPFQKTDGSRRLVRGSGPASSQAAPGRALRVRGVAQGPGQPRLRPNTRSTASPTRWAVARSTFGSRPRPWRSSTSTGRRAHPGPQEGRIRDRPGAHARLAPCACGMDSVRTDRLGPQDRIAHGRVRRTAPRSRPHPEQGYRSCLGLKRLLRAYGAERMEAACRRALDIGTSYKSVKSILATGLDQADNDEQHTLSLPAEHAHVRGPQYYTTPQNGKES